MMYALGVMTTYAKTNKIHHYDCNKLNNYVLYTKYFNLDSKLIKKKKTTNNLL